MSEHSSGPGPTGAPPLLVASSRRNGRWSLTLDHERLDALYAVLGDWLADPNSPRLEFEDSEATYDHETLTAVAQDARDAVSDLIDRSRRRRELGGSDLVTLAAAAQNLTVIAAMALERGAACEPLALLCERLTIETLVALDHRFTARPDGSFVTRWSAVDRMVIDDLAAEVERLLESDSPDVVRLFPPAYPDDAERDAGYAALARDELVSSKRASLETLRAALDRDVATEEDMGQMMRAVNDLRLVLGTRLDVSESTHGARRSEDAQAYAIYEHLTNLLAQIIEVQRTG